RGCDAGCRSRAHQRVHDEASQGRRPMTSLRVTLVQQPLTWQNPAVNRDTFGALLAPLAGQTDLIVLPETFTTGFSMDVKRIGEPAGGPTTHWIRALADRLDAVITGSVITAEGG